ncbi:Na+/H+ antiporter NhaC family protein [Gorillibacterium sp. sgz5001074]|uniref:Na+/H+ antiporter NhaC family protein n=1 Tax=Gorillibacterium sp. sgz5001074 TaxID=3446695 RepID=UPI003F679B7C
MGQENGTLSEGQPKGHPEVPFAIGELSVVIGFVIAGLAAAYAWGLPLAAGFSLGFAALWLGCLRKGISSEVLWITAWNGFKRTKEVLWILLLVGMVIPTWMASGTIPYMIDLGLRLMEPSIFATGSFLLCACISMILGTSTGTMSSAGIPLMGMAAVLHVPLPLVAGAVVSGAFVGDRASPFSSAHQLVASSTGLTVRQLGRALAPTTVVGVAAAILFFVWQDVSGHWSGSPGTGWSTGYDAVFRFHPILAVPPVLLALSNVFRLRIKYAFLISIAAAVVIGMTVQQVEPASWPRFLWSGYASPAIPTIHSKGVAGMLELMMLIGLAGAFNGILEELGLIRPYAERIIGEKSSLPSATLRTGLFGLGLGLVSCTQTLPIMMSGRTLAPSWTRRMPAGELARTVADTSLVLPGLVPWNMLAILCGTILGIPAADYIPYAAFLWSLPILTIIYSFVKSRNPSEK